jgi:hypothetical protein
MTILLKIARKEFTLVESGVITISTGCTSVELLDEPQSTSPLKSIATPPKSGKRLNHYTVVILPESFAKAKRLSRNKPFLTSLHKHKRHSHFRDEKAINDTIGR